MKIYRILGSRLQEEGQDTKDAIKSEAQQLQIGGMLLRINLC